MISTHTPLRPPTEAKKIFLHVCCAPCSGAIVECLLTNGLQPTIFYHNPNIFPREEYERRKAESIRHAASLQIPFIDGDGDHDVWLAHIRGLENEPERGRRCIVCFRTRLTETARQAHVRGFSLFATTLAASRWKSLQQISDAGQYAATLYPGLVFWANNWRSGGLSERRRELIKEYQFYNQTYCGCEFSIHPTKNE
ncbi:MAG: epoxyqueuosine reductase QueH [Tannerella sp.]|jgi:predicted adenine nucleotide alpha hydrolase (AANH) superfamily ATPase|nr:epoxyqueuosine reductase QueH [Tannerella sp.]